MAKEKPVVNKPYGRLDKLYPAAADRKAIRKGIDAGEIRTAPSGFSHTICVHKEQAAAWLSKSKG